MARPQKPPRLWFRADIGRWLILDRGKQTSTGTESLEKAQIAFAAYMQARRRPGRKSRLDGNKTPTPPLVRTKIRRAISRAKDRAKTKGRTFSLTEEHILNLYLDGGGRCAVTGLPFRSEHEGESRCNPYAMSIDRIDCRRGYEPDNVRLVLFFVNSAISDFGEKLFREIIGEMLAVADQRALACIPDKKIHSFNVAREAEAFPAKT